MSLLWDTIITVTIMAMDITVQFNPMAHSKQAVFSAPFEKEKKKDAFLSHISTEPFLLSIFITMSDTKSKSQQRISLYFWGL